MIQKIELQFIAMFTLLSKLRDLLRDFSPLSRGFSPGIKKCRNRPKLSSNNKLIIQKNEVQFIASFTLLSRVRDLCRGFSLCPVVLVFCAVALVLCRAALVLCPAGLARGP